MAVRKGVEGAQRNTDGWGGTEDGYEEEEEGEEKMAIWPPPEWEGRRPVVSEG